MDPGAVGSIQDGRLRNKYDAATLLRTSSKTLHNSKSLCSLNGSMFLLMVPLKSTGSCNVNNMFKAVKWENNNNNNNNITNNFNEMLLFTLIHTIKAAGF